MTDETAVPEATDTETPSAEEPSAVTESPSDAVEAKPEGESEASPAEAKPEEDDPEEWAKFLKSKGLHGKPLDKSFKEVLGKLFYKQANDNSALAKEIKDLKAYRDAAEKAKSEKPAEPPVALKEVDDYITALTKDVETNLPAQEAKLFKEYRATERDIIRLEYELEKAEDIDKRTIQSEIRAAKADLKLAERAIQDVQKQHQASKVEIQRAKGYRKNVEDQIEAEGRAKQEQAEALETFNQEFPDEIDGYVKQFCDEFKIPADEREDVHDLVYDKAIATAARFRNTDTSADDVDWKALVKAKVEKESKRIERAGRSHFAQVSKEKKLVTSPPARPAAPSKATDSTPRYLKDDALTPAMLAGRQRLEAALARRR